MVEGFPDNLGGWGVLVIFKEGCRLLKRYFRLLHPFIMAFFLPLALIGFAIIVGEAWIISQGYPLHPHHHHHHHHHSLQLGHYNHHHVHPDQSFHHHFHKHYPGSGTFQTSSAESTGPFFTAPTPAPTPPPYLGKLTIVVFVAFILTWVLQSLAIAAFSKIVQYIYANGEEDPSVIKSTFKSLPEALFRQFVTFLWTFLIITAITIVISGLSNLVLYFFIDSLNINIVSVLIRAFVDVGILVLGFFFLLIQIISVLEPANYGLAALKKSSKLVRTKLAPALVYVLVTMIIDAMGYSLVKFTTIIPATGKLPFWTVCIFVIIIELLNMAVRVYMLLVLVVLYFSSKLKHDEEEQYLPVRSEEDNPYTPLTVPSQN